MPYVYILTNKPYGTLYTGYANDIAQRIEQHRAKVVNGFSSEHDLTRLVWLEVHESAIEARQREALIKKWHRDWKINLIQENNPEWRDLANEL
jgi:putative endonuclease